MQKRSTLMPIVAVCGAALFLWSQDAPAEFPGIGTYYPGQRVTESRFEPSRYPYSRYPYQGRTPVYGSRGYEGGRPGYGYRYNRPRFPFAGHREYRSPRYIQKEYGFWGRRDYRSMDKKRGWDFWAPGDEFLNERDLKKLLSIPDAGDLRVPKQGEGQQKAPAVIMAPASETQPGRPEEVQPTGEKPATGVPPQMSADPVATGSPASQAHPEPATTNQSHNKE